eukprot:SAG11_NODE_807_length_7088_cov_6.548862_6_plen_404_part_00
MTAEETAECLASRQHGWRVYTDGGCDDQQGDDSTWGAAGCLDPANELEEVADLYGPVVTDPDSGWFLGADRGSNQTGELCGVIQALLWLLKLPSDDNEAVFICSNSLCAINQVEGRWRVNRNEVLIRCGQHLLAQLRQKRNVYFCHVKGHCDNVGNEREDQLVQWGKTSGPFSRVRTGGIVEGEGTTQLIRGRVRRLDKEEWKEKIRTELILGEEMSTTEEEPEESEDSDTVLRELAILLDFDEDNDTDQEGDLVSPGESGRGKGLANLAEVSRPNVEGNVECAGAPLDSGWRDTFLSESDVEDTGDEVSGSILQFLSEEEECEESELETTAPAPELVLADDAGMVETSAVRDEDESGLEKMALGMELALAEDAGAVDMSAARDETDVEDLSSRLNKMCVERV